MNEVERSLDNPSPELSEALSIVIQHTLSEHTKEERAFWLLLLGMKTYRHVDEPEFELIDHQLAAEEIANAAPDGLE